MGMWRVERREVRLKISLKGRMPASRANLGMNGGEIRTVVLVLIRERSGRRRGRQGDLQICSDGANGGRMGIRSLSIAKYSKLTCVEFKALD
jgi:hypothetical protein